MIDALKIIYRLNWEVFVLTTGFIVYQTRMKE